MGVFGAEKSGKTDEPVCAVLEKEGKVEVARKGVAQWSPAQTNQVLQVGDRLRTGLRSRATLRWSNLSVVRVNELTSMEIQPPEKAGGNPQADLKSGAAYFFSREKPSEIQFRTPVASGAIRGTEFNLAVEDNGRTVLSLLDGEVDLANAQGAETFKSGQQGTVEPGRAPAKTAMVDAINIIQWVLYYPAVVDPDELGLTDGEKQTFSDSVKAYRSGDLLQALASFPENRPPATDAERLLQSAVLLAAGRVEQVESNLKALQAPSPVANALRELIAAVKHQQPEALAQPTTASEWMARSYFEQSRSQLQPALDAARAATKKSPGFGAAWVRVAELEFSFGRTPEALTALNKGLELSPRNAEGLTLKGFLLAAQGKTTQALDYFNQAVAVDGALANAWLGRGLVKIRQGSAPLGRDDLQVAATLEPLRAVLRSYLGKAFSNLGDTRHAQKELALAKQLDPNDPTSWLYSAILNQQENRINEAINDLQQSKELNNNRSVFRSRLLLDQDQAVRGANLAAIYRDAGMFDISVQEASRAVEMDYANYSAHLFLAESYDALRDPKLINLRYETPALSELLVANLLAPPSGGTLSQNISQQEYSRFFDADHFGLFSSTEYSSRGNWLQNGSQYGISGKTGYSIDAFYRSENGQRPNNDLEQLELDARIKQQITPEDSVFFQITDFHVKSGDLAQYYNQSQASQTLMVKEKQEPSLLFGYHHEWSPGSHTLFLGGRFDDVLNLDDSDPFLLFHQVFVNPFTGVTTDQLVRHPALFSLQYRSELVAYSAELQHIWQTPVNTLIVGARYQNGTADNSSVLERSLQGVLTNQNFKTDLDRLAFYAYENWQPIEQLRFTVGVAYDRLHYPRNIDTAPITSDEATKDQVSPKAGILWTPAKDTHVRAVYTRSLGGVFFDQSVRLEPVQIAGFNQAFRSLIPESFAGLVPGTRFETWGVGLDQAVKKTGSYFDLEGQFLKSKGSRTVGILQNSDIFTPPPDTGGSTVQTLHYEEKSLLFTYNQLIDRDYSVGASYKLTHAEFDGRFIELDPNVVAGASALNQDVSATLHQLYLFGNYYHPSGIFGQANAIYSKQINSNPAEPGDSFWQYNLYVGYRFLQRRAEARLGLVNLTDRDYRLSPLTLYNELPRERMLVASLKFYF